jgi:hypothetical protein
VLYNLDGRRLLKIGQTKCWSEHALNWTRRIWREDTQKNTILSLTNLSKSSSIIFFSQLKEILAKKLFPFEKRFKIPSFEGY